MSSDNGRESNSAKPPPKKITKCLCVFQHSWLNFVPSSVYRAYGILCKRQFSIAHVGIPPTADNILAQKGINERKVDVKTPQICSSFSGTAAKTSETL